MPILAIAFGIIKRRQIIYAFFSNWDLGSTLSRYEVLQCQMFVVLNSMPTSLNW
jgi:hypothetical protein